MINSKILRFETSGVKNLKNKIEIDFSNLTFSSGKETISNVKAIYGGNGCGKSAIIHSIKIYSDICVDSDALVKEKDYFLKVLNKESKEMYFKTYFNIKDENKSVNLAHEITLSFDENTIKITHEKLVELTGKSLLDNRTNTVYEIEDGVLVSMNDKKTFDFLEKKTLNLLLGRSFISVLFGLGTLHPIKEGLIISKSNGCSGKTIAELYYLSFFCNRIAVLLEEDEFKSMNKIPFNDLMNPEANINFYRNSALSERYVNFGIDKEPIRVKDFEKYEKSIAKLLEFLKIFKPSIKNITIDKTIDGDIYYCKKIINYDGYDVDFAYESTGIKKIAKLYEYLDYSSRGGIVFIDELDANINDPFLIKLIEFMLEEGKGQLCFTSHNLKTMKILSKKSKSIDVINELQEIVPVTKNGNYSPDKLYFEGLIRGLPFNIDTFDFYKCLYYGDNN